MADTGEEPVPDVPHAPRHQPPTLRWRIRRRLGLGTPLKLTELCRSINEGGEEAYTVDQVLTELRRMEDDGIAHSWVHGGDLIERFSSTPYGR